MRLIVSALLLLAAACTQPATPPDAGQVVASNMITISGGWAGPTPNGVDVSSGYLTITNSSGAADRLLGASSARAQHVQLHEMSMDASNVMQMRDAGVIDIPAGATVTLAPGGMHLMFMGVTSPFVEGERIPLTLTFERAGAIDATLDVRRQAPDQDGR